jgi:hypothetical protein
MKNHCACHHAGCFYAPPCCVAGGYEASERIELPLSPSDQSSVSGAIVVVFESHLVVTSTSNDEPVVHAINCCYCKQLYCDGSRPASPCRPASSTELCRVRIHLFLNPTLWVLKSLSYSTLYVLTCIPPGCLLLCLYSCPE